MSAVNIGCDANSSVAALVEELIDKLQAGEGDAESFIAAHPEHEVELRRLLPALQMMASISASVPGRNSECRT